MRGSYAVVVAAEVAVAVAEVDVDRPSATYRRPSLPPPMDVRQSAGRPYGNVGRGRVASVVVENGRLP